MSQSRRIADYLIETRAGLVSVRFTGHLTFRDILDYAASLRADPRFVAAYAELVDLRFVESVSLSSREIMILADQVDPFSAQSRRAFLVKDQSQVNVAHLHRILRTESESIRVFFSLDEAREWIRSGGSVHEAMERGPQNDSNNRTRWAIVDRKC
jgi:hypothetical protein